MDKDTKLLISLGVAGALVGLGQALALGAASSWKAVLARCISTASLGVTAAFAVVILPDITFPAQVGLACALASLGTSALEKMFQKWLGK